VTVTFPSNTASQSSVARPDSVLNYKYATVIPVYNSAKILPETLRRTVAVFENNGLNYEIVLVNDGSRDESWQVLKQAAAQNPRIVVINLLRNYGQHAALLCGLRHSTADYIITIDDDLQNPPEMMIRLINKAMEGHDLVCGKFYSKKHAFHRRIGSKLISVLNEQIFGKPRDFSLTNYRLLERSLADRICNYRTPYPYLNGLAVKMACSIANVDVEHHERSQGQSGYSLSRILKLVFTIMFNYSSFPLRFVCGLGLIVSTISFVLCICFIAKALLMQAKVPGWTTIVVLMSFYGGLFALMLGMLGEYMIRLLNTASEQSSYEVREKINHG
jgi:glycosyltransferase involved in cell wall biosynthesis